MTGKAKIILIATGTMASLLVTAIAAFLIFAFLFDRRYGAEIEDSQNRGKTFGRAADYENCQRESVRQIEGLSLSDFGVESIKAQYFFAGCLETGKPSAGFCTGVPTEQQDILAGDRWKDARCSEFGWQEMNPNCRAVLRSRLEFCEKR